MIWQLWRRHPFVLSAFVLAMALTTFFAVRLGVQAVYWANPAHHNQAIEGWMTAGYIGKSWGVDPVALDTLAGLPLPQEKGRPQPLVEIARDRGVPLDALIAHVEASLQTLLAQQDNAKDTGE